MDSETKTSGVTVKEGEDAQAQEEQAQQENPVKPKQDEQQS